MPLEVSGSNIYSVFKDFYKQYIFKTFKLILILLDNITAPKQLKESVREMISSSTKQKHKN